MLSEGVTAILARGAKNRSGGRPLAGSLALVLLASLECQVFLLGGRRAILWCDVHIHFMCIDLFQYLSWCSSGKITLMKYRHNMPIFINGEDTQDLSYNIGWLHLCESSTRTFKREYISLALSLGSISNELSFFITRW